jgi:Arylsulfotransferase (ASST)
MKIAVFSWLRQKIELVIFFISAMALVFGYGIAVERYRLFPHAIINSAIDSARDWKGNWRHFLGVQSKWLQPTERTERISWRDPERSWPGYTFFTGFHQGGWGAFLLDIEGEVVHEWPFLLDEMWEVAGMPGEPDASRIELSIHGAVLLPDGGVILNVNGGPLTRIDRCGNYIYAIDINAHHSVDVLKDGTALVPGRRSETERRADRPRLSPGPNGYYRDDTMVLVSPEGEVLEEHSIIGLMYESDLGGMLLVGSSRDFRSEVEDPLHANDVEYLTAEMADAFPMFEAGDLMISLREIATVAVVDGETRRIKWFMTGPFFGQHDPDFLPNGNILLYDNRITGPRPELGYSRVLEIDPLTREIVWEYVGSHDDPMYSDRGGRVQLLPNGNVLAVEPRGGRIIEIARNNGDDVVWQFVNLQQDGLAGEVFDGLRFAEDELDFVGQPCP